MNQPIEKAEIEDKLKDLVKEFSSAGNQQHAKLAMLAKQAQDSHTRLAKSVNSLQESLDYLRICIKYQLFDLEATRRENKYLREMLEEQDS